MKYTPSINIAQTVFNPQSYIVTQNAKGVVGNIVDSFNAGVHSFNIIGSYGTGKSNFILALQDSLENKSGILVKNKGQFNGIGKIKFVNIVGDYASLQKILTDNLFPTTAVSLPFISSGGSALITTMIECGICIGVRSQQTKRMYQKHLAE